MAEWLYETGIGESRAALVEHGLIVEALIEVDGTGPRVGTVAPARVIDRMAGGQAIARLDDGDDVLLDRLPAATSVGALLTVAVTREAIAEPGRNKRAKGVATGEPPRKGPDLLARIGKTGHPIRRLSSHEPDLLEAAEWSEILDEAITGDIAFAGGVLRMTPTPAMTLFDVDGPGEREPLAIAAARAVAGAIRRHAIGGSIGIDFPTLTGKAARVGVGEAVDAALPLPFERTAMNGFGFLQIVRPRPRASLPERLRTDPAGAAARAALRRLEREPPGALLHIPSGVAARLHMEPDWLAELVRRTGRHPIWPT